MLIRDALAHGPPLQIVWWSAFFRPVNAKILYRVESGFGSQHTAQLAVGLIVKLGGVSVHPVFDALALLAAFHIRLQFSVELGGDGSGLVHFPAEVAHHVGAAETQQACRTSRGISR